MLLLWGKHKAPNKENQAALDQNFAIVEKLQTTYAGFDSKKLPYGSNFFCSAKNKKRNSLVEDLQFRKKGADGPSMHRTVNLNIGETIQAASCKIWEAPVLPHMKDKLTGSRNLL